LLVASGRENEARQLLDEFLKTYPDQKKALERVTTGMKILWTMPKQ